MNDFDRLRYVLETKAVAAGDAAGLAGKLALPNETFTPPVNDTYGEFWFLSGSSKQVDLGGGGKAQELTVGIFQFTIYAPEKTNDGPSTQIADVIRRRFNNKEWLVDPDGYVKLLTANVKTPFPKPQNGYWIVIVDGTYHFYHRDPSPLAFNA